MIEGTPQTERNTRYDALLTHGYWLSNDNGAHNIDGFRGSLRTRLSTRAAVDLYFTEGPMNLVFTGGKLKGPNYPATSEIAREEAVYKYGVPSEHVITAETGLDTETESLTFESLAREHGWTDVGVLSFAQHNPSVSRFFPKIVLPGQVTTVEHRTVEDVLEKYDDPLVAALAQRLKWSIHYGWGFNLYELAKTLIMNVPGGKDWLYEKNRKARTEKNDSRFNDLVTSAIDVYKS